MRFLIGLGLIILGAVLFFVTDFAPFLIIFFIGLFLFASIQSEEMFYDYRIANSEEILLRKRYYMIFLPFAIISYVLTIGRTTLKIVWKEEYFRSPISIESEKDLIKLSRKEYIAIRNEQRIIYSTQILSKEFMESSYTAADIGYKRKKIRLIIVSIIAGISLTMLLDTSVGLFLTLICESVFIPMIILWIPEYKDAKILQQAYDKAVNSTDNMNNT